MVVWSCRSSPDQTENDDGRQVEREKMVEKPFRGMELMKPKTSDYWFRNKHPERICSGTQHCIIV